MKKSLTFRIRTFILTLGLVASLIFYFLVSTVFKKTMDWIDFIMLASVQIIMHFLYYPDGELNGEKDEAYDSNKKEYNRKANLVNDKRQVKRLESFTKVDFENRKRIYIQTQLGYIGLDLNDYEYLLNHMQEIDLKAKSLQINGRLITLKKYNRGILKHLLYKKLPVEINSVNTIMSANESIAEGKIKDRSKTYTLIMHVKKIITATLVGGFLAYVGYTRKDNFGLEDFVMLMIDLTSMLATAVLSYSSGEVATKKYKCEFYVELSLFLSNFFEWLLTEEKVDINKPYEEILLIENKEKENIEKPKEINYNENVDSKLTI